MKRSQIGQLAPMMVLAFFLMIGNSSFAAVIDFESIPASTPSDGLSISTQFEPTHGVTFSLEGGGSPVLAKVGSPLTAFLGYNLQDDQPAPGTNVGEFFLTDDGVLAGIPSPLVVDYTTEVSAAGGVIIDIDWEEEWTIEAFNSASAIIDIVVLGPNNSLDGSATPWSFNFGSPVIKKIRFRYTGTDPATNPQVLGIGLAFDNFTPSSSNIPTLSEWGMIVFFILLVGSALWVIRRRRRQESA